MRSGRLTTPLALKFLEPERFYREDTPEEKFLAETEKKIIEGVLPATFEQWGAADFAAVEKRLAASMPLPTSYWKSTTTGRISSSKPNMHHAVPRAYAKDDVSFTRQMYYYVAGHYPATPPVRGLHAHMVLLDDAVKVREEWGKEIWTYGFQEYYPGQSTSHAPPRHAARRAERRPRRQETPRLRTGELVQLQAQATQRFRERRR